MVNAHSDTGVDLIRHPAVVSRLPRYVRRRWVRLCLFALLMLVSLGLGWAMLRSNEKLGAEQLVGWAGLFVSLAALAVSLADLFPPLSPPADTAQLADDLAVTVRDQWEEEVAARRLRDPRIIPLAWSATDRPVTAPPEAVVGPVGARILRLSLNGRLDGDFTSASAELAEGYRQIPSGRLVVLGQPGAGKTVLATMLSLGLLAEREAGAPVPVLLAVSTWDPVSESLDDWIVGTLATAYYGGRPDIPKRLLNQRRLLPILDGLDEMPEASRRSAVRALNETCGEDRGVVLTCRSVEYQDVIEGGSPALRRAPVVEVAPVPVSDAIAYLGDVSWPAGVEWEPVYAHLRENPDSPLAAALSTPLALTLARTVYRNCDRDPSELLAFDGSHAVEDHLVDHVITAAYAPPPGSREGHADGEWQRRAERAEQYLTYLATYLHRYRERDLVWWLMSNRLFSRWAGLVLGIALGLLIMIAAAVVNRTVNLARGVIHEDFFELNQAAEIGAGCAILITITWYAAPDRPPGSLSFSRRGSLGRLRRGFAAGLKLTSILTVPTAATTAVAITFSGSWPAWLVLDFCRILAGAAGGALAVSLALSAHAWLDAPPQRATGAGPLELLRQDRTSSLAGALTAGVFLGAIATPLVTLGIAVGFMVLLALTHASVPHIPSDLVNQIVADTDPYQTLQTTISNTLLPAVAFALLILLTRSWPRFALLRLVLAAQGKLPWRLTRFLSDSRDRQLLRQSAGAYQFRHIRLQERLASRSLAQDRAPAPWARSLRRRRIQVVTAVTALLACGLTVRHVLPEDTSGVAMVTGDVEAMVFSPSKNHTLVTVSPSGEVRRWDTRTGEQSTSGAVRLPGWRPWGSTPVLAARKDGVLIVPIHYEGYTDRDEARVLPWDGTRSRETLIFDGARPSADAAFRFRPAALSVGGKYLLTALEDEHGVTKRGMVRNTHTGAPVSKRLSEKPNGRRLALSADGTYLVQALQDIQTSVDNIRTGKRICSLPAFPDSTEVAISAPGRRLATSHGSTVWIWDEKCRKVGKSITGYRNVTALALNADGTKLAVSADGVTRLWDPPPVAD